MKIRNTVFVAAVLAFTFTVSAPAQQLVGAARTGTLTAEQVNNRATAIFGKGALPAVAKAVDYYKISYRSKDEKGRSVVLTGLVSWPRGGAPNGLVIYCHGTIADRRSSPSYFAGSADTSEREQAIMAFNSGGYAVAQPDYIGLGDSKAPHPYPLAVTNSASAVDIIEPARRLAERERVNVGPNLFVTGYSEGGAVAMAALRELERRGVSVTAAAPLAGPYDLSGATRKWILRMPTNQAEFAIRLYLLSYMANYFRGTGTVKLTDVFRPSMALTVNAAYSGTPKDEDIIKRLVLAATLMRAKNSIFNVITPQFRRALETFDTSNPLIAAMAAQDVYDWAPRTPMLMVNLEGDAVVDPANTQNAFDAMRRRGVGPRRLKRYVIRDQNLNHVTAVGPSLAQARKFFDGGYR